MHRKALPVFQGESLRNIKAVSSETVSYTHLQDFRLIPKKTVFDNLSLAMRAVGATPRDIRTRIPYVLELSLIHI